MWVRMYVRMGVDIEVGCGCRPVAMCIRGTRYVGCVKRGWVPGCCLVVTWWELGGGEGMGRGRRGCRFGEIGLLFWLFLGDGVGDYMCM